MTKPFCEKSCQVADIFLKLTQLICLTIILRLCQALAAINEGACSTFAHPQKSAFLAPTTANAIINVFAQHKNSNSCDNDGLEILLEHVLTLFLFGNYPELLQRTKEIVYIRVGTQISFRIKVDIHTTSVFERLGEANTQKVDFFS